MFSNLLPQILKLKSTPSHHPRLTALMCANVTLVAPTGLPESIHHLFVDLPAPHLPLLPLCPGQLCATQGQLCARRAFPHHSHHHISHSSSQPARQFLCCNVPSPSCFSLQFSRSIAKVTGHLSAEPGVTPLPTAATGSSASAQPTQWEHQQCQGAEGADLSSQPRCPPRPAFFPCSRQSKGKASPQEPPLGPRNNILLMAVPEKYTAKDGVGKEKKNHCFPLASPGRIHTQKRDLHLKGCWGIGCPWYQGHILHTPQSPC